MLCRRCGRKLRSDESIRRGYGKNCFAKIGADEKRNDKEEVKIGKDKLTS